MVDGCWVVLAKGPDVVQAFEELVLYVSRRTSNIKVHLAWLSEYYGCVHLGRGVPPTKGKSSLYQR